MGSYYDLAAYDFEEGDEYSGQGPPMVNLCAAASYVGAILVSNNLQYAAMGGFAMVCRGSTRATSDVNMATNATMKQLWRVVEPKPGKVLPRLILPNTRLLDKVIRIFVRTGPSYGDKGCIFDMIVEVDVNVFGGRSGPSDLSQHIETLAINHGNQKSFVNVLDIYYMMRTKLRTLNARAAVRDFDDIDFLLANYGHEVMRISDRLDLQDRASFIDTDLVQSRGIVAIRQYQKLLSLR